MDVKELIDNLNLRIDRGGRGKSKARHRKGPDARTLFTTELRRRRRAKARRAIEKASRAKNR